MPSTNKTALQFSGLNTYANPLGSQVQPGSMLLAQNIRLDKPGSITPRPGESVVSMATSSAGIPATASVASWNQLYSAGERLLPSYTNAAGQWVPMPITHDQMATVVTPSLPYEAPMGGTPSYYSQSVATPTARGLQWGSAVLTNLAGGIARIVPGGANSGSTASFYTVAHAAGLPPPGPPQAVIVDPYGTGTNSSAGTFTMPNAGSAIQGSSVYAYRALYGRADTNGVQNLGPPSGRAEVANAELTGGGLSPATGTQLPNGFNWNYTSKYNPSVGADAFSFILNPPVTIPSNANNVLALRAIFVQGSNSQQGAVGLSSSTATTQLVAMLDPGEPLVYFGTASTAVNVFVPMVVAAATATTMTLSPAYGDSSSQLPLLFLTGGTSPIQVYSTAVVTDPTQWQASAQSVTASSMAASGSNWTFATVSTAAPFAVGTKVVMLASTTVQSPQQPLVYCYTTSSPYTSLLALASSKGAPAVGDTLTMQGVSPSPQIVSGTYTVVGDISDSATFIIYKISLSSFPIGWVAVVSDLWGITQLGSSSTIHIISSAPTSIVPSFPGVLFNWTYPPTVVSWSGPRNVTIQTPYDQWLHALAHEITTFTGEPTGSTPVSLYYYQLYRSPAQPIVAGVEFEASDNLQLVDQQNLPTTAPTGSTSQITTQDVSPDAVLGAEIYTAPNSGTEEIAQYAPPAAADLTLANNVALYANFSVPANVSMQLVAVAPSASTTSLPQMQPGDGLTITYTPPTGESPVSKTFVAGTDFTLVTSAGSASANINGTVSNLCAAINNYGIYTPMTGSVVASLISTFATAPGSFIIQCSMGQATFTLAWIPATSGNPNPFVGFKATNAPTVNGSQVAFALASQPEAVPLTNTIQVGTTTYVIRRALTCQGGTFLFKDDGIYSLTGVYGNYGVQVVSNTARLVAENTAVSMQDSVIALTTEGVVLLSASGVQILSQAIHDDIFQLIAQPNISKAFAVVDQAKSHYLLWLCSSAGITSPDICYVYNILTNNWSLDLSKRQAGQVNVGDGVLYTAAAPGVAPFAYPQMGATPSEPTYAVIYQKNDYGVSPPQIAMNDEVTSVTVSAGSTPTTGVLALSGNGVPSAATLSTLSANFVALYTDGDLFDNISLSGNNNVAHIESIDAAVFTSTASNYTLNANFTVWPTSAVALAALVADTQPVFLGAGISTSFKIIMAGDDAGHVKQFQEYTLQARNTSQLWWSASLETDYGFSAQPLTLQGYNPGNAYAPGSNTPSSEGWGAFAWGEEAWGGNQATWSDAVQYVTTFDYATARSFVQQQTARGHVLFAEFSAVCAGTTFEIIGLTFNWLSTNTTMQR